MLLRRRQELRTPGAPLGVRGVDVGDPDVEEAADPVGISGVSSVTVGLSSVGPPPTLMMSAARLVFGPEPTNIALANTYISTSV